MTADSRLPRGHQMEKAAIQRQLSPRGTACHVPIHSAHQPPACNPDHEKLQRLINYVSCLGLDCPTQARFESPLGREEIEAVASGLYPYESEIRFIKGAVEARDPIESTEVQTRRDRLREEFQDTVFCGKTS